jgi:hypothetical protein
MSWEMIWLGAHLTIRLHIRNQRLFEGDDQEKGVLFQSYGWNIQQPIGLGDINVLPYRAKSNWTNTCL